MFRADKLTGARRRAWLRSEEYSPTVVKPSQVPKHIFDRVRYPRRLKAIVKVGTGISYHYAAVIGSRIVLLSHPNEEQDRALAFMAGRPAMDCGCDEVREFYATWSSKDPVTRRGATLKHAGSVSDLPQSLINVRERCRPPTTQYYRKIEVEVVRMRRSDEKVNRRALVNRESPRKNERGVVYETRWGVRWAKFLSDIEDLSEVSLSEQWSAASGSPSAVKRVNAYSYEDKNRRLRITDAQEPSVPGGKFKYGIQYDPLTWYVRVRGRAVPPRPSVVPVSAFEFAGITSFVGFDVHAVPASSLQSGTRQTDELFPLVCWTEDGRELTDSPEAAESIKWVEYGLRTSNRLSRRDDALKTAKDQS